MHGLWRRPATAALDVSALSSGADLTDALGHALDYSEQADTAFAAWAIELAGRGCQVGNTGTGNFKQGDQDSNSATRQKKRFVAVWNPLAGTYGLPQFLYSDV